MKTILMMVLLSGCVAVDVPGPLPVDGQTYRCALIDAADGRELDVLEVCGPWTDWMPAAERAVVLFGCEGQACDIDCRGTQKLCNFSEDE